MRLALGLGRCPDHDPQAHAMDARRRAGRQVPRRSRVHRRRRRASPSAHRRPRPHQRRPGRAQPLLEARRRARGQAGESLLDTYEAERRPADARNIQRSLENARAHMEIGPAFGLDPKAGIEANWGQMRRIWSGKPEDAERRRAALRAIRRLTMESSELNVEYGYPYDSAAVVPDGSPAPQPIDPIRALRAEHAPGQSTAARVDRRRGRIASAAQGSRAAGAIPAHRRRGRRRLVRGRRSASHPPTRSRSTACASASSTAIYSIRASCGRNTAASAATVPCSCGPTVSLPGARSDAAQDPARELASALQQILDRKIAVDRRDATAPCGRGERSLAAVLD